MSNVEIRQTEIDSLLKQINGFLEDYRSKQKQNPIDFNLFSVIGCSNEELIHSAMLGALLDPQGKHCQGLLFLEKFVRYFELEGIFDTQSARLCLEKSIGLVKIEDADSEGGRIDILISDKNGEKIIIENKIYAKDQPLQLVRYHNYAGTSKIPVLYLTIDGRDASEESKGSLRDGIDYKRISYKHDIINWLNSCLADKDVPIYLKECINNYLFLVKKITRTSEYYIMKDSIKRKVIENISAAKEIASVLNAAKAEVVMRLFNEIFEQLLGFSPQFCYGFDAGDAKTEEEMMECVKAYYRKGATDSTKRFGIRVPLCDFHGNKLFLKMQVDENIYFDLCSDVSLTKNTFDKEKMPEYEEKNPTWQEPDKDAQDKSKRLYWRYPIAKDFRINVREFSKPLIEYAEGKNNLAQELADNFKENIVSLRKVFDAQ